MSNLTFTSEIPSIPHESLHEPLRTPLVLVWLMKVEEVASWNGASTLHTKCFLIPSPLSRQHVPRPINWLMVSCELAPLNIPTFFNTTETPRPTSWLMEWTMSRGSPYWSLGRCQRGPHLAMVLTKRHGHVRGVWGSSLFFRAALYLGLGLPLYLGTPPLLLIL